jgi:microcompartment protein CcmK/EutM
MRAVEFISLKVRWLGSVFSFRHNHDSNPIRSDTTAVLIERGSTARIVGNRIEANDGAGVTVDRSSEADVAANTIGGDSGDAVLVTRNSGANLSSEREGPTDGPNMTDPASNNRGVAVRCEIGG